MSADMSRNLPSSAEARGRKRILVAKLGLDGHDRGAKVISMALRDAGFEVVYTGIRQTPEQVCAVAAAEDVDVVGISLLSGAHGELVPVLLQLLRSQDLDVPVVLGGIIPESDRPALVSAGVSAIFGPGEALAEVVAAIDHLVLEGTSRTPTIEG